jgi:hypothetical protein
MGPSPAIVRKPHVRLSWATVPWLLPFWVAGVGWQWWKLDLHQLEAVAAAGAAAVGAAADSRRMALAALAGVVARYIGFLIEAGFYAFLWASRGKRLHVWRYASWLVSISLLDVLAESVRRDLAARHAAGAGWALVLGAGTLGPAGAHAGAGVVAAFGTLGLVTVARMLWAAKVQAIDLGTRLWAPLAATAVTWAATRLALGALADLARGRSPLP